MKIVKKVRMMSYYCALDDGTYLNVDIHAGPQRCHQIFVTSGMGAGMTLRYFIRRFPSGFWICDNYTGGAPNVLGPYPCRKVALLMRRLLLAGVVR